MRRFDPQAAAGLNQTVKLLHGADHVGQVFDHVDGAHTPEGVVRERVGEAVEIADDVGGAGRIAVDADRAGIFFNAAADVENLHWTLKCTTERSGSAHPRTRRPAFPSGNRRYWATSCSAGIWRRRAP